MTGRQGVAAAVVLGAAVLLAVALVDPATSPWLPPCPFRAVTGWLCPGCGSARALHALLHGDPLAAVRFNPLTVIVLGVVVADLSWRLRHGTGLPFDRLPASWLRAGAGALVVFAVGRNVWG